MSMLKDYTAHQCDLVNSDAGDALLFLWAATAPRIAHRIQACSISRSTRGSPSTPFFPL
jgi:hypothetical protein